MLKNKKINNSIFKDLFIFEMANNHSGDLNLAKKIVDQCYLIKEKYALNAAVKLQYRNLKNFIHPDFVNNKEVKHIKRFVETELSENDFNSLVEYIKKKKLIPISTPFDETSVDLCVILLFVVSLTAVMGWLALSGNEVPSFDPSKWSNNIVFTSLVKASVATVKFSTYLATFDIRNSSQYHCGS